MVTDDARSVSTWNREKGLPLTELERAIQLTTNWIVIVVMLSTCCPVRFVMRSTLGQQQQNLGLGLTIIRPVLERIQGFLLRTETRMILYNRQFSGPGHHGLGDVSIQLIDRVSGEE